jgi:NAD(P)-dependent dehydrogenase (short-subunit alcohol dehydrogenase family)
MPLRRALMLRSVETPQGVESIGRTDPMRRAGTAEEIAEAFEFLLTNEYVTGQTLVIDGGYSLLG